MYLANLKLRPCHLVSVIEKTVKDSRNRGPIVARSMVGGESSVGSVGAGATQKSLEAVHASIFFLAFGRRPFSMLPW